MPPIFDPKEAAAAVKRRAVEPALPIGPSPEREAVRRITASSAAAALPSLAIGGVPAVGGLVQGAMDKDAITRWNKMVKFFVKQDDPEAKNAKAAIRQLLSISEGVTLVNELWALFGGRGERGEHSIEVRFVDKLPKDVEGAGGVFQPEEKNARLYTVYILNDKTPEGSLMTIWPQGKGKTLTSLSTDPASNMARTLHHELLHVWYLNTQDEPSEKYRTGHADVGKREIRDVFWNRLETFTNQQDHFTGHI
jgi:hypothetical protein